MKNMMWLTRAAVSVCAVWVCLAPCQAQTLSNIVIISDFEAPTFTAGSTFAGVDLWSNRVGSGTANITPDGGGTGATNVLEGTQSAVLGLSGRFGVAREWGAAGAVIGADPWVLRGVMSQLTAGGQTEFWVSNSAGVGGAGTPAGLIFHSGGNFRVQDLVLGEIDTGVSWTPGDVYRVDIVLDLAADTYGVVVENLTAGTGRQNLDTGLQMADFGGGVAASGGVILINDGTGGISVFDTVLAAEYTDGPIAVAFTEMAIADETALSFTSVVSETYRLRFSSNPISGTWTNTPYLLEGTGLDMFAFDPTGFSTQKTYQVVIEP
jgi:hypothetical protein